MSIFSCSSGLMFLPYTFVLLKKLGGHIAFGVSVCLYSSHILGTMYARILKFHICIAN